MSKRARGNTARRKEEIKKVQEDQARKKERKTKNMQNLYPVVAVSKLPHRRSTCDP